MNFDNFGSVIFGIFVVAMAAMLLVLPSVRCEDQAKMMNLPYKWSFTTGCMVEIQPKKWVPLANYRVL